MQTKAMETLQLITTTVKVPFKAEGWDGESRKPAWWSRLERTELDGDMFGWTYKSRTLDRLTNGLYVRTWEKEGRKVYQVNESKDLFQGGQAINFFSASRDALLLFTKDIGLNQKHIQLDRLVSQPNVHISDQEVKYSAMTTRPSRL
jgi:hypothetical protein